MLRENSKDKSVTCLSNGNANNEQENSNSNNIELIAMPRSNIIEKNFATRDEAFHEVENLLRDEPIVRFSINEKFQQFNIEYFKDLKETLYDKQVIAFQSNSDGKFCITWCAKEDEIYAVNIFEKSIKKEELRLLCEFILEFIGKCLRENHSGLSSSEDKPDDNFNVDLPSLGDSKNLNLLFNAALNGNTQMIPILLLVAFHVNMVHPEEGFLAVDYAFTHKHFETLFILLKNNSYFPFGFNIDECPNENVKAFAETSQNLHEFILTGNLIEVSKILSENPNLRYFFNLLNQSASVIAIVFKKFDIYELLLQNNMYLAIWEDIEAVTKNLSWEEKEEIHEIHFRNKKDLDNHHLNVLMSKCSTGYDDDKVQERLNHVMRAFQTLNKFPLIQILLKVAAMLPNLHIVFDFNRDSVNYLDPNQDRNNTGLFYKNGRINVGAMQLLDALTENQVFATIAHELCHFVIYAVFDNFAKPYRENDKETETEFKAISRECRRKKKFDRIIGVVYDLYPQDMFHAELIVRIPHFYAHYWEQPERIEQLKIKYKSLFEFYENKLVPKLNEKMIDLKKKAEKKQKSKERKISMLIIALAAVVIVLSSIAAILVWWFYEPTYSWSNLGNEQKIKVIDGNLKFEGVDMKFHEIYGRNESANGVFQKLTSSQIKILMKGEILNLNKAENEFLHSEIFLVYQNLTESLKKKVEYGKVDFQGQSFTISSLLMNNTEKTLKTLNSRQIIDLAKNKSVIEIGQRFEFDFDIYIERRFVNKYENEDKILSASDLIHMSMSKKVILLSDDAGTGKTTKFKHFVKELKQKFPLKWIHFVDLKTKTKVYQKYQKNPESLVNMLAKILELSDLNLKIFEIFFYKPKSVIFLWDGFDEISPTFSSFILKLTETIDTNTENIQFISTRPHCEDEIQELFNCPAYELMPYSRKDNDEYLNKFYASKNLSQNESEKAKENSLNLVKEVLKNEEEDNEEFTDYIQSPLMLYMIAQVSLNFDGSFDASNLYTIYKSFIETIIRTSNDKGELIQYEKNKIVYEGSYSLKEAFEYFAVKKSVIFESLKIRRKYMNMNLNINELSRYGILIFDSEGNAEFVHRTYHEFYFAEYIIDNVYNTKNESDCDEIKMRFNLLLSGGILESKKVKEFLLGYLDTNKPINVDKRTILCIETKKILNKISFGSVEARNEKTILILSAFLEVYPLTSDVLEVFWLINENATFFSWYATVMPANFVENLQNVKQIVSKYFKKEPEKVKKLLFGMYQRGNVLYGIYKAKYDYNLNTEKFLNIQNITVDFDLNIFRYFSTFSQFYSFIKPHLIEDEIRELLRLSFVENLVEINLQMWNDVKEKFSREEIQEIIYKGTVYGKQTLEFVGNFSNIKQIFDILEGSSNQKFLKFIHHENELLIDKKLMAVGESFELIWRTIDNRLNRGEKKEILKMIFFNYDFKLGSNILRSSVELSTVDAFSKVLAVYQQYFKLSEMKDLCKDILESQSNENSAPYFHSSETVQYFIEYITKSFTFDEIKKKFKEPLIKLYSLYRKEVYNVSNPFLGLLRNVTTLTEFEGLSVTEN